MKPVEAFDVRGYVGYLSAYITAPSVPALLVGVVRGGVEEPKTISVNLEDYGWYPVGLQFAVKEYDEYDARAASALAFLGVLKFTGTTIPGPHGPGWKVYDLVPEALKPGVLDAWQRHLQQLATPIEAVQEELARAAFGRSVPRDGGTCVACGKGGLTRKDFKDELSWREFQITKFCQKCQDEFYGEAD